MFIVDEAVFIYCILLPPIVCIVVLIIEDHDHSEEKPKAKVSNFCSSSSPTSQHFPRSQTPSPLPHHQKKKSKSSRCPFPSKSIPSETLGAQHLQNLTRTDDLLRNGNESDDGSAEDVEPAHVLGGRKGPGANDLIPKGQAEDIANKTGKKAANEVKKPECKDPSRITLDLKVKVELDAHLEGWIEIGLL